MPISPKKRKKSNKIYSKIVIKKPRVVFKDLSSQGAVGFAYGEEHLVEIDPNQSDRELFLTTFHEVSGHLVMQDLTEKQVVKLEKTVGVALWLVVLRLRRKWRKEWGKLPRL